MITTCPKCNGKGFVPIYDGIVIDPEQPNTYDSEDIKPCPMCLGWGEISIPDQNQK